MSKWKSWLFQKFLPAWCKEDLLEKNAALVERLETQTRELEALRAYVEGVEYALRRGGGRR